MMLERWQAQLEYLLADRRSTGADARSALRSSGQVTTRSSESFSYSETSRGSFGHTSASSGMTRTTAPSFHRSPVIHEESGDSANEIDRYTFPSSAPSTLHSPPSSIAGSYLPAGHHQAGYPASPFGARDLPPLDLMLVLSVSNSGPSSLKSSIVRSTLDFVLNNVGVQTRISLVIFSAGDGPRGRLRKTPFISVGTRAGFQRFERAVNEAGRRDDEEEVAHGEPVLVDHPEDRVNVVTACNLALDVVMQRKASK